MKEKRGILEEGALDLSRFFSFFSSSSFVVFFNYNYNNTQHSD